MRLDRLEAKEMLIKPGGLKNVLWFLDEILISMIHRSRSDWKFGTQSNRLSRLHQSRAIRLDSVFGFVTIFKVFIERNN